MYHSEWTGRECAPFLSVWNVILVFEMFFFIADSLPSTSSATPSAIANELSRILNLEKLNTLDEVPQQLVSMQQVLEGIQNRALHAINIDL